jgi:uncharacterized protein (DUF1015 family)
MDTLGFDGGPGLSLAPFRALRPNVDTDRLGRLLCPPYDVIDEAGRAALLAADADNAVAIILPEPIDGEDRYVGAADTLQRWRRSGLLAVDAERALYVYEMRTGDGAITRGLLGAVELRDPADGVILPHENTMPGPVAGRLALMLATETDLEPIYLVYAGGGPASAVVAGIDTAPTVAEAVTPDGIAHRLWAVTDSDALAAIAVDLAGRRALIADGHHRYATYLEVQARLRSERGPGPWDRGLTLLVDSSSYGPQVQAIHRVLVGLAFDDALSGAARTAEVIALPSLAGAQAAADAEPSFAAVLSDGQRYALVRNVAPELIAEAADPSQPAALTGLDVNVLHRVLVPHAWGLVDSVETVDYAHSIGEALASARATRGTAVLMRPTPVAAVAAVAAAGGRMPRKSTLFTPKPASGLVMLAFADQLD